MTLKSSVIHKLNVKENDTYLEKQFKDIKFLFILLHLKKIILNQSIIVSDRTTNMQFIKMQLTGHWLRYSSMPNLTTLLTRKSLKINFNFK